jgi:8-oxo-dGTP diphosphatase
MIQENKERPKVGIGALVVRDGKILIGRRLDGHGSGTYMIPGGHLEFGESFEECAMREATEECGLTNFISKGVVSLGNNIVYGKHYVGIGVLLLSESGEPYDSEPEKCGDWKWYDPKDIPDELFYDSEKVIKNYLGGKIYSD